MASENAETVAGQADTRVGAGSWLGGLPYGMLIAIPALAADQLTKQWIMTMVPNRFDWIEITSFFNIVHQWNTGVSFGMFGDVPPLVLKLVAGTITLVLLEWLRRSRGWWMIAAVGLVIGGAIGNIVDRAVYGAVFDFLDFHAYGYRWPAFNVADSAICVGVGMLLFDAFFRRDHEHQ